MVIHAANKDVAVTRYDLDPKAFAVVTDLHEIACAQFAKD
jgi:hypothetical protein